MATVGAVLTGGESRRMGRTKALVEVDSVPMAARVAAALAAGGCERVVLVGGDPAELAAIDLPVLPDLHPGAGPLGGVLSAIDQFAADDEIVVAACDLPFLDAASVEALIKGAARHPGADVVVSKTDRIEPACALWRADRLTRIEALFDEGIRALHAAIERLDAVEVTMAARAFVNVNRPGDVVGK